MIDWSRGRAVSYQEAWRSGCLLVLHWKATVDAGAVDRLPVDRHSVTTFDGHHQVPLSNTSERRP